jgi:hypothetical protein
MDINKRVAYLLDCNLATIEYYAMTKMYPLTEIKRQINLANLLLELAIELDCDISGTRMKEINTKYEGKISAWARQLRNVYHPDKLLNLVLREGE